MVTRDPSDTPEGSEGSPAAVPGGPRFVADQLIFGSSETLDRWQFPDVTADRYQEASWKARYDMKKLTQTDCFALAEAVNVLTYIVFDCPTNAIAVEKIRKVRNALNARAVSKEPA